MGTGVNTTTLSQSPMTLFHLNIQRPAGGRIYISQHYDPECGSLIFLEVLLAEREKMTRRSIIRQKKNKVPVMTRRSF